MDAASAAGVCCRASVRCRGSWRPAPRARRHPEVVDDLRRDPAPARMSASDLGQIEVTASEEIPREQVEAARRRMASLARVVDEPLLSARLTLRQIAGGHAQRPYVADASVLLNGR